MKRLIFLPCIFIAVQSLSQYPILKMWDIRYGGPSHDIVRCFKPTSDGGYILGGNTISDTGGDKTSPSWNTDYRDFWIVKTDSLGIKQWDKDFGGVDDEYFGSVSQTSDGGYILGGISRSNINGDKTQPLRDSTSIPYYPGDYWILKLDAFGNKLWDKDFGTTGSDALISVFQTPDGGYILGGTSEKGISGDKTKPNWGYYDDFWIIKTDSLGNFLWDKDFGTVHDDIFKCMRQTTDGGFIIAGYTAAGISGDKTEPVKGYPDYWILKIDSLGNKQWDKSFGGPSSNALDLVEQTSDGGYIIGGMSRGGAGFDKTQSSWGQRDIWLVKTDASGNKLWDKNFGGTDDEYPIGSILSTSDGGYLISGCSWSDIGGDKTEDNFGNAQSWIIKVDAMGTKQWDKTILTPGHDYDGYSFQSSDGCYLIVNSSLAAVGGYKTQPAHNNSIDYWMVKICDTVTTPTAGFTSNATVVCPDSCINFINLSYHCTSYQWFFPGAVPDTSTFISPLNICYNVPGNYDVTLISTNANGSDTITLNNYISVYPDPGVPTIVQTGDTLTASTGYLTYQWYRNTWDILSGATNHKYIATVSGNYTVICIDTNGCETQGTISNVAAGVKLADVLNFLIYPNPVQTKLTIQNSRASMQSGDMQFLIYNLMGEKMNLDIDLSRWTIDCRPLDPGIYFLEINRQGEICRFRFNKQ